MYQRDVWSLSLGRWGGVYVRIHIFFVLFAVLTGFIAHQMPGGGLMWLALTSVSILFLSVLAHEFGHYYAARRLGGHMDSLVLGPVGGLRPPRVPRDPQSELLTLLAGPAVSLSICFCCLIVAGLVHAETANELLNLFEPVIFGNGNGMTLEAVIRLTCWINWWLLILNAIPAFPFDGGRAMVALLQVLKPQIEYDKAVAYVATFARLVAVGLFLMAFVFRHALGPDFPAWLPLLLLSVFVFFSARVEEAQTEAEKEEEELFGYDFSQGYTSLERSASPRSNKPGPITVWWRDIQEKRRKRRAEIELAEDAESDEILQRLHEQGMESLSPREKALLKRVSERYRSRNS